MKKKVIYFIDDPQGHPSASFNRLSLFQKGFKKMGVECIIEIIPPINNSSSTLINIIRAFFKVMYYYCKYFFDKNNFLIIYGENYFWNLIRLKRRCKLLLERNEYPNHLIISGYPYNELKFKLLDGIDGFITCSDSLSKYYGELLKSNCPMCKSRLIVDISAFSDRPKIENKISYCGDWGNNKDGVDILIKSFAIFLKKHGDFRLELIGGSTTEVEQSLELLAKDLGIYDYIDFVHRIPHSEMPEHLCNAYILALARPNNKQAEGGVPSKVGEYLSTGRPVVLTKVGELSQIMKDGYDCYMAEPDSVESFSNKLIEAVDCSNTKLVGEHGYALSKTFNYDYQAKLLYEFLNSL